ncbi:thaumatin-like protein [Fomitopsis serialis]|uniref:thaumatin-like protein n=1 Tax=Fomitopsis serialis TaxID=139415 RepID=UPI00200872B4|nr:thaumatin-like protein [Neoantrodia serialis]KAH9931506.1 thaumatin-like protein [Neoantrodia serialis]
MKNVAAASLLFAAGVAADRTFTVVNNCDYTIWSYFTGAGTSAPTYPTGWEAAAGTSVTFSVPEDWNSGRIWGRRDCDFSASSDPSTSCADGGCNGGLECAKTGGRPPATVAEFTLGADGTDNYDVSLVDGFNLPMSVTNNVNCAVADCPVDLNANCPTEIKGPYDSSGNAVGCKSACEANLDGDQSNSPNCCSGSYNTPATCPSSGVKDYSYFKSNCPNSYAYAYDESSGTALWTCASNLGADYTITFCPSSSTTTKRGVHMLDRSFNVTGRV